jgi:hypothetical protein
MSRPTLEAGKEWLRRTRIYSLRNRWNARSSGARIMEPHGYLQPGTCDQTFVVVCGGAFDQSVPNAATMCRMGWCHGFEALGIPYLLANAYDLERVLAEVPNPICWITESDYHYLDASGLQALSRQPHAVLVDTWFDGETAYYRSSGFPNVSSPDWHRARLLSTEPRFLFTISPASRLDYYYGWSRTGMSVNSIPLACDLALYGDPILSGQFVDVEMGFVGGFWPYKARQFDVYLKPHARRMTVFGYSAWPYGQYGGQLSLEHEPELYAQAKVSPVINEPHVCAMGVDINERVFKVLGAGGLAITDACAGYRDWFSADELLVPESPDEFHELIAAALREDPALSGLRERGRQAVLARHTYRHRAESFLDLMYPKGGYK